MEEIIVNAGGCLSRIFVGQHREDIARMIPGKGVVIITDDNVYSVYGKEFPGFPVLRIKPGEGSKQLKTVELLAAGLLEHNIDRSGFLLGIGGGVVCDITGFLASVFMRGISFGFVSTSLLSQVDASTGGKNGVNLGEIKNLIGIFRQPEFVVCDTEMLKTLPEDEYFSGLAELIKTGIIGDPSIIESLEKDHQKVRNRDPELLSDLVGRAVKYKASVVTADERESGLRRVLNFGHTFGHAIELHKGIKHGFAVAAGMELSLRWSRELEYIDNDTCERILNLFSLYNLRFDWHMSPDDMRKLISHDKKKSGGDIYFVFVKGTGKPFVKLLPVSELIDFYSRITRK
ncbi:MAG TPA: 3-dehydroquinate synthase [Bacteroidales bacterium]|nr:3-dehydroquinate synthase [Bacteroidales bacterium]HOS72552.1 3-dehydroquinate synthase [Bacteroidales bacterium]HQH25341.1 3-dehydroquinate synthase [Bacteroidales bacterium]HQJ82859.1 3-dehydroquinate synthase [Bacteroidales bacterium]